MPIVTEYRNGVPSWADVSVEHIETCAAFYSELFGWDAEDQGDDAGNYHMFRIGGRSVAGMGRSPVETAPLWSAYMSVDDLDRTLEAVTANGGTVVMPRTDIFASGSMAIVEDPSGATVSLWQPGDHIGAELVNAPNSLAWHELASRDVPAATAFYGAVLGWTFQEAPPETGAVGYQMINVGERVVGGIMAMDGDDWGDLPSHWMVYFAVEDADAAAARVGELGGSVSVEPFDIPIGRFAVVNDPDGNAFSVMSFGGPMDEIAGGIA